MKKLTGTKQSPAKTSKPKLAVWKFASCDGCQLSLLDCENELLEIVDKVEIANFLEASRRVLPGPYDLSLVEGSITTEHDRKRALEIREKSKFVVTIGACANAGGIQALRNYANLDSYINTVYANPKYIECLDKSLPISQVIPVDFELQGCPISKKQLIEVVTAFAQGQKPKIPQHSVCLECKQNQNPCVLVSQNQPCLGPVTQGGCEALCPSYHRGCFGCYGPKEEAQTIALRDYFIKAQNLSPEKAKQLFQNFYTAAPAFEKAHYDKK